MSAQQQEMSGGEGGKEGRHTTGAGVAQQWLTSRRCDAIALTQIRSSSLWPSLLTTRCPAFQPSVMLNSLARRSASVSAAGWSRTGARVMTGRQGAAAAAASLCRAAAAAAAPSVPAASSTASPLSLHSTIGRSHARVFHSSARRLLQLGGGPPSGGEQGAQGTWVNPNNVPAGEALKKYWSVNTES